MIGQPVTPQVLEAEQLEDYLVGREVQTPKAVPEPPLTTGQEDVALATVGGFLAELRGRVPKGGQRGTVVSTPIPRRSTDKWKPVLGKPTVPTATAASMLIPQEKAVEEEVRSSVDPVPMETVTETLVPRVEATVTEAVSTGPEIPPQGIAEPSLPDSARVTTEETETVVAWVTDSTSVEVTVAVGAAGGHGGTSTCSK